MWLDKLQCTLQKTNISFYISDLFVLAICLLSPNAQHEGGAGEQDQPCLGRAHHRGSYQQDEAGFHHVDEGEQHRSHAADAQQYVGFLR